MEHRSPQASTHSTKRVEGHEPMHAPVEPPGQSMEGTGVGLGVGLGVVVVDPPPGLLDNKSSACRLVHGEKIPFEQNERRRFSRVR